MKRRESNHIPQRQPIIRAHPTLVYPHLAFSQRAVETGTRHALHLPYQVVIQTLPCGIVIYSQIARLSPGAGLRASGHGLYKSYQLFPYTVTVRNVVASARALKPGLVMNKTPAIVWACTRDARCRQSNHTNLMDVGILATCTRIKRTLDCLTDNEMNRAASTAGTQNQL